MKVSRLGLVFAPWRFYTFVMDINSAKVDSPSDITSVDEELNLTGMKCPLPVLKARRKINQLPPRSVLKVTADDPAAPLDCGRAVIQANFRAFYEKSGRWDLSTPT